MIYLSNKPVICAGFSYFGTEIAQYSVSCIKQCLHAVPVVCLFTVFERECNSLSLFFFLHLRTIFRGALHLRIIFRGALHLRTIFRGALFLLCFFGCLLENLKGKWGGQYCVYAPPVLCIIVLFCLFFVYCCVIFIL